MQEMSLLFTSSFKNGGALFWEKIEAHTEKDLKDHQFLDKKYSCQPSALSSYRMPLRFPTKAILFQGTPQPILSMAGVPRPGRVCLLQDSSVLFALEPHHVG